MKTIETYLPVFKGYYNSIFEDIADSQIENDIDNINSEYNKDISYDDLEIDYDSFFNELSIDIFNEVVNNLKDLNLINGAKFQKLVSPKFYNFTNDSINVSFDITNENQKTIYDYLLLNITEFSEYLTDKYTSCSGFTSFHSNDVNEWMTNFENIILDAHKLGSILDFICANEEINEYSIYDYVCGNICIDITNYDELISE